MAIRHETNPVRPGDRSLQRIRRQMLSAKEFDSARAAVDFVLCGRSAPAQRQSTGRLRRRILDCFNDMLSALLAFGAITHCAFCLRKCVRRLPCAYRAAVCCHTWPTDFCEIMR